MITIFDTETSGLPDMNARARDPKQPHLVQFAAISFDDHWNEVEQHNLIAKPDGWTIPDEASAIHGITNEIANDRGVAEKTIATIFLGLMRDSTLLVAHNIQFDKFLMRIACRRFDLIRDEHDAWWKAFPTFCTMHATTNICKLQGKFSSYKWPKLIEAHQHIFGEGFEGAHDALADVRACARIYRWLQDRKQEVVA